jgi:hypothetical protein
LSYGHNNAIVCSPYTSRNSAHYVYSDSKIISITKLAVR